MDRRQPISRSSSRIAALCSLRHSVPVPAMDVSLSDSAFRHQVDKQGETDFENGIFQRKPIVVVSVCGRCRRSVKPRMISPCLQSLVKVQVRKTKPGGRRTKLTMGKALAVLHTALDLDCTTYEDEVGETYKHTPARLNSCSGKTQRAACHYLLNSIQPDKNVPHGEFGRGKSRFLMYCLWKLTADIT